MRKILKNLFLVLVCSAISTAAVFAHGKGDIDEKTVDNLNSWQDTFDLDTKKPGKYNIMITARDLGGNTYVEGPHNIYYDPKSDLPVCGITNPYPNMRVVSNLNIVGTCVDDDGVDYVELILDGDTEHPIKAEGGEFWSYYLNTLNLDEGPHTIQVTGYDINGLPGNPTKLTWQLDRNQPLTQIVEKEMGLLVAGNVKFDGVVSDGNGIKSLEYSVDGGKYFTPVKVSNKQSSDFTISIDTKKFPDGPAILWFRATDQSGSVGLYSFLYFIDNTKPDVKIVAPADGELVNGKYTVAGYAKDTIGVTSLTWTYGNQNGVIDLVPGNPYWAVNLDSTVTKEKSGKFTIKAIDRANNIVEVSKNINFDQEADKPVIKTVEPVAAQIFGGDDPLYVRGIVKDDDGVQSVKIQLDGQAPVEIETKGTYYAKLADQLTFGKHKITIVATDINGVASNPVVTEVESRGFAPEFGKVKVGKADFYNGMEIHPESNSTIDIPVFSPVGLTKVHTVITWGRSGVVENDVELKNAASYTVSFPIASNGQKGVVQYKISATDTLNRVTEFNAIAYITNTSEVKSDEAKIVLDDTRFAEDGSVINNPEFPATAYVIGAKPVKVELDPPTAFATAKLEGNQIKLTAGNAIGSSPAVTIRVTTDKGHVLKSTPIKFKSDTALPKITISKASDNSATPAYGEESVTVSGKVTCETGVGNVYYRILGSNVDIKAGVIASIKNSVGELVPVSVKADGSFNITIPVEENLPLGVNLVEIVAESAGGNKAAKAMAFSFLPEIEAINGKMPVAKAPVISYLEGYNVYAVAVYQGELDKCLTTYDRNEMKEGANLLDPMTVTTPDGKPFAAAKYTANKAPTLNANFALVNGEEYKSGMPVVLTPGSKVPGTVTVYIDTGAAVSGASYEITGEETPGGDNRQTGSAKLTKPAEGSTRWTAEIPLANLPSRVNNIALTIKAGSLEQTIKGSVTVIRENDQALIDDAEKIYSFPAADTLFDSQDGNYILSNGSEFYYYANYQLPIKVELVSPTAGLSVSTDDRFITLSADKDGVYRGVYVRVTDANGDAHNSERVNFIADTSDPTLVIETPKMYQWLKNGVSISGTATHPLGVRSVEYSVNGGETWNKFAVRASQGNIGVTFSETISLSSVEDGLIRINVRATDNAGHTTTELLSCYKDTTPPAVTVVEPIIEDVVNGQNLIVFKATDESAIEKAEYVASARNGRGRQNVTLNQLTSAYVGTKDAPIDDGMNFVFTDAAGNTTTINSWDFKIDNKSDLPVAEIHVPEEMQVITRDFTISGVIYDDDGESTIYYKIDNGEYRKLPEMGTSFAIDVPLSAMTDNEHTVTVYAVDINGVKGEETKRTFRISLEEPKGAVQLPTIDTSVRQLVKISGVASDKNGIAKVQVSLDNGNSYNDAVGTENWSYTVDTRAIPGGTQVVFLKVTDNYGIQGLYSSLINIDNDAPYMTLELPIDDSTTTGTLFLSGYTYDNVEVDQLYVTIRNLERTSAAVKRNVKIDRIISEVIDMSDFADGFYNVELTGKDKAGNVTNVSRNIHLDKSKNSATVDILYPLNGEHKQGQFSIYGQTESEVPISSLKLFIDGKAVSDTSVTNCNFFRFDLGAITYNDDGEKVSNITAGKHTYRVDAILENGKTVRSREQTLSYDPVGPWVTIDNFTYGDFATDRPFITGRAGYVIDEEELAASKAKDASTEFKAAVAAKRLVKVELSLDNGKTFTELSTSEKWKYRVENEDIAEGYHFLLVRATMANGETAINRIIIQIDNTNPTVKLIAPATGGRYNQLLDVQGLSHDDVELKEVKITLRKGDKSSYEVPSFIQGLYVDFHFWGATLYDVGAGLTFFDDNVKLQGQFGQFTQQQRDFISNLFGQESTPMRYGGSHVVGMKILANIASIPFSYFFGRDWEWLYSSVAIGAQFSWFDQTSSGKTQALSALLAQVEFPQIKRKDAKAFSSFSVYSEFSLWFIPTDIASTQKIQNIVPKFALGLRNNIF